MSDGRLQCVRGRTGSRTHPSALSPCGTSVKISSIAITGQGCSYQTTRGFPSKRCCQCANHRDRNVLLCEGWGSKVPAMHVGRWGWPWSSEECVHKWFHERCPQTRDYGASCMTPKRVLVSGLLVERDLPQTET